MSEATEREQDVGRPRNRRRAIPSPETAALLDRYQSTMRAELTELLAEIRPAAGQLTIDGAVERPGLDRRRALWDLAVKLARELGAAVDEPPEVAPGPPPPPPRRAGAPRLTAAARRQLGSG